MKYVLYTIFILLTAILLIGQRFGFVWAGGTGYIAERRAGIVAIVGEPDVDRIGKTRIAQLWQSVARGETIRTGVGERVLLQLDFANTIALDENTDVMIEENNLHAIRVKLLRGRVYADTHVTDRHDENPDWAKTISIDTKASRTTIETGSVTIVNYDFLDRVSIAPIETEAEIVVGGDMMFNSTTPVIIDDAYGNMLDENAPFSMSSPDVIDFYQWVQNGRD